MSHAELKEWAESEKDHNFVVGYRWRNGMQGVKVTCEGCGAVISLFPSSRDKLGPRLHAICRETCLPELRRVAGELPFGGYIRNNVLPKELEEL